MNQQLLLVFLLIYSSYQESSLQESTNDKDAPVKIIPKSYALSIQVFPVEKIYIGEVTINVTCLERTNVIRLDAHKNLIINDTKVSLVSAISAGRQKKVINVQKIEKLEEINVLNIVLETCLYKDAECEITISFSGQINTHNTSGLFMAAYVNNKTKQSKWIIAAQLARSATHTVFPCFENPLFKVLIDVSIQRPVELNSLSTMSLLKSINIEKEWVKDVFNTTPPMSISSLAICISDLTPINLDKPELQVRVWPATELLSVMMKDKKDLVYKTHMKYEMSFGVKYPIPKLDYVALPGSARVTVLNSWGLIISSNDNVGYTINAVEYVLYLELRNQWFGNLITGSNDTPEEEIMEDAFKSFLPAYLGSQNVLPSGVFSNGNFSTIWRKSMNQGMGKEVNPDSLSGLYTNYYELGSAKPRDDPTIKALCSISKARLIYKMLASALTDQTFTSAFKNFVKKCQFKTYHLNDFFDALTEQAHADKTLPINMTVNEIATYWINNYRVPYVTAVRDYDANSVLLTQSLFVRERPYRVVEEKDRHLIWPIPIVLKTQDILDFKDNKPILWMQTQKHNLQQIGDPKQFIIINAVENAPYMVNYDNTNWNMIANFLQSGKLRSKLPLHTRAKLVHDALNLAYAGALDPGTALNVTAYLKDETEYFPWRPFFLLFDHIGKHISGTETFTKYQKYVNLLTKPLYARLKSKRNHDTLASEFINELEEVLGRSRNEQLLKEANIAYEKWMENLNFGYKNVQKHLCIIYEIGTQKQWEFGIKTYQNLDGKQDIDRFYLIKCLITCTRNHSNIKTFLDMTLFQQNHEFTYRDFNYAIYMLTRNADGFMATFEFLRENWNALKTRLEDEPEIWKHLVYTATNLHKTQDGLDQVSAFYSEHRGEFGAAEETITEGIKNIKEEVQWTNNNLKNMEDWLDNYILKNAPK